MRKLINRIKQLFKKKEVDVNIYKIAEYNTKELTGNLTPGLHLYKDKFNYK